MAIDKTNWGILMGALDAVTDTLPGTDPDDLDTLRDALESCLDAVNAEAANLH